MTRRELAKLCPGCLERPQTDRILCAECDDYSQRKLRDPVVHNGKMADIADKLLAALARFDSAETHEVLAAAGAPDSIPERNSWDKALSRLVRRGAVVREKHKNFTLYRLAPRNENT